MQATAIELSMATRKRKTVTITIDPLVWDAVSSAALKQNTSASRWLESFVFDNLKNCGLLPNTVEKLGELRGGDRKSDGEE
ncbi:hypothetical protein H6G64_35360 [Calothrix sp. FACHB-156]|nr:hypothetical protein [Calothrix sp. FACHB-156]